MPHNGAESSCFTKLNVHYTLKSWSMVSVHKQLSSELVCSSSYSDWKWETIMLSRRRKQFNYACLLTGLLTSCITWSACLYDAIGYCWVLHYLSNRLFESIYDWPFRNLYGSSTVQLNWSIEVFQFPKVIKWIKTDAVQSTFSYSIYDNKQLHQLYNCTTVTLN